MLAKLRRWLLSDGFLSFGLRMATIGAMLVNNILVARMLPNREQVGHYFELWGIVYFFAVIGHLGIRTSVVQWIAQAVHRDQSAEVGASIRTSLNIVQTSYGLLAVGVGAFLIALPRYQSESVLSLSALAALWLFSLGFQYSMSEIFRGFERHLWAGTLGGALTQVLLLGFLCGLWCFAKSPDILLVVAATVLASLINFGMLIVLLTQVRQQYPAQRGVAWRQAIRQSFPMLITSLAIATLTYLDVIVLSCFISAEKVAVYAASTRMAALVSISNQISLSILTPRLAKAIADHDQSKIRTAMRSSLLPVGAVTCFVFVIYVVWGGWLLRSIFGPGYDEGWTTLLLVSLTQGIGVFAGRTGILLMMSGHQWTAMKINILGTLAAVLCQAVGAYTLGAVGVAVGTMLGYIVLVSLQHFAAASFLGSMDHSAA